MSVQLDFIREQRSRHQVAVDHVSAWIDRLGERYTSEHPDVQNEIRSEALERYLSKGQIAWQGQRVADDGRRHPGDTEVCRMRIVSRYRLKRYGALPDLDEWKRQVDEVRISLGLAPRERQAEREAA